MLFFFVSVHQFCQISDKLNRRNELMFKHKFKPSRDPSKGYTASYQKWCNFAMSDPPESGGGVAMNQNGDSVVKQC